MEDTSRAHKFRKRLKPANWIRPRSYRTRDAGQTQSHGSPGPLQTISNDGSDTVNMHRSLGENTQSTNSCSASHPVTHSSQAHQDDLWLEAQKSHEIISDPRWPKFARAMSIVDGAPSCDGVLREFANLSERGRSKIRQVFDGLMTFLHDNREAGSSIAQADPTKATSVAWGCALLIATVAVNARKTHTLARGYEAVAEIKHRYDIYISLYLHPHVLSLEISDMMKRCALSLYTNVIKYIMTSWCYLQQKAITHSIQGLIPTNAVHEALRNVETSETRLREALNLADSSVLIEATVQTRGLSAKLTDILVPLQQSLAEVSDIHSATTASSHHELLQWVSESGEGSRLQEILEKHMPQTGQWFLAHEDVQKWLSADYSSTIWLVGQMGTGKSDIVAQLVTHLHQSPGSAFAYYFCDKTNTKRALELADLSSIYRCLLKQLLHLDGHGLWPAVSQLFKERRLDGRRLSSVEAKNIIIQLGKWLGSFTIVIDAVDELDIKLQPALLLDLCTMQEEAEGSMRIFFSSRDQAEIRQSLNCFSHMSTLRMQSCEDVTHYVRTRVDQDFLRNLLKPELKPFKLEIVNTITSKACGMFRWAASAISFLEQRSYDASQTLARLRSLPPDIKSLYDLMYRDIRILETDSSFKIQNAFLLVAYQRVRLTVTDIAEAMFEPSHPLDEHYERRLLDNCSDFIDVHPMTGYIKFSHASVQDYFISLPEFQAGEAHAEILKICISALGRISRGYHVHEINSNAVLGFGNFIEYAICNWVWHASQADVSGDTRKSLLSAMRKVQSQLDNYPDVCAWLNGIESVLRPPVTDFISDKESTKSEWDSRMARAGSLPTVSTMTSDGATQNDMSISGLPLQSPHRVLESEYPKPSGVREISDSEQRQSEQRRERLHRSNSISSLVSVGSGSSDRSQLNSGAESRPVRRDSAFSQSFGHLFSADFALNKSNSTSEGFPLKHTRVSENPTVSYRRFHTTKPDVCACSKDTAQGYGNDFVIHSPDCVMGETLNLKETPSFRQTMDWGRPYRCLNCLRFFSRYDAVKRHERVVHNSMFEKDERISQMVHGQLPFDLPDDLDTMILDGRTSGQPQRSPQPVAFKKALDKNTLSITCALRPANLGETEVGCHIGLSTFPPFITIQDIYRLLEYFIAADFTEQERHEIQMRLYNFFLHLEPHLGLSSKYKKKFANSGVALGIPWRRLSEVLIAIYMWHRECSFCPAEWLDSREDRHESFLNRDLASDLASVHTEPPNSLFVVAKRGIWSLMDHLKLSDDFQWSQRNILGQTPLIAAMHASVEVFSHMIDRCPIEAIHATTASQKTPLHIACEMNNLGMGRKILSRGGNSNALDQTKRTPLYSAIQQCNVGMVEMLIQHDAVLQPHHETDVVAIWLAIAGRFLSYKNTDHVRMLDITNRLSEDPVAVEFLANFTVHGYTLLHVAATYNNLHLAKFLMRIGADVNAPAEGHSGQTALHIAANGEDANMCRILIASGAHLDRPDHRGQSPLHCASSWTTAETLAESDWRPPLTPGGDFRRLVDALTDRDHAGRAPLQAAIARGATSAVQWHLRIIPLFSYELSHNLESWRWPENVEELVRYSQERFSRQQQRTLILPYNISSTMTRALHEYGTATCVSITAERPLDYRLARLAEAKALREDESVEGSHMNDSLERDDSDDFPNHSCAEEDDPDSEKAIRELRIQMDEENEGIAEPYAPW